MQRTKIHPAREYATLPLEKEVKSIFYDESYFGLVYDKGDTSNTHIMEIYDTKGKQFLPLRNFLNILHIFPVYFLLFLYFLPNMLVWLAFYLLAICITSEAARGIFTYVEQSPVLLFLYENNLLLQVIMAFFP